MSSQRFSLVLFLVYATIFLSLAPNAYAQDSAQEKSVWDQIVDGWNSFWGGVVNTLTTVKDFLFDKLGKAFNATKSIGDLVFSGLKAVGDVISNGLGVVAAAIGNWGDPELYSQVMFAKAMGYSRERVCDYALAMGRTELLSDTRSINEITPTGLVGVIAYFVYAVKSSWGIVSFIIQNIVVVHCVIILAMLTWGLVGAVEKRDADYFIESVQRVIGIFKFYARVIAWFIERLVDFATMVAQWLETIIPF